MKEDPNPLATLHPRARKVCAFLKGALRFCWWGVKVCLLALIGCLCLVLFLINPWFREWFGEAIAFVASAAFYVGCASAALCCAAYVLRLVIVALFFMRYSLGQLMGTILFGGACMTMLIQFPDELKHLPVMGLAFLAFIVWVYIVAHDPEDPWFTPAFVRRTLGPKPVVEEDEEEAEPDTEGPLLASRVNEGGSEEQAKPAEAERAQAAVSNPERRDSSLL
jgi:hypothetical protein